MTSEAKNIDEPHQISGKAMGPFFRRAHERKAPLNVQVQITDLCNLRCEHCYNSLEHKRDELSYDEITDLLKQLKEAGTLYLCLTGGEPTLHPRFAGIARAVREQDLALEIITNATLLNDEHYKLFHELQPHYIAVSLHGIQSASHDALTRSPESFNKTKAAIERMHKENLPVQLRIPITRYNSHEVDDLLMYAEALDVSYRFDCNITYREDGDPTSTGVRVGKGVVRQMYDRRWNKRMQESKFPVIGRDSTEYEGGTLCAAGHTFCYIDSFGTVHPCPSFQRPAGNIREQSFSEIWYGSEFLKRLRETKFGDIEGCSGCSDMGFCNFCPGDARLEGNDKVDGFAHYKRACNNAALNREAYEEVSKAESVAIEAKT